MGNQETVEFSMSTATKTSRPEARSGAPKISPQAVVLLVDDQPIVAEALRRLLADVPDITFHYCGDPREAVKKAAQIDATVIIHDIQPDIDGMSLVRYFRSQPSTQRISIVVLSVNEDAASKAQAFRDGANDYLVKMPNKIELVSRIMAHSKAYLTRLEREDGVDELRNRLNQQEQVNTLLKRLADRDEITGVANRRNFTHLLEREWRRGARENKELSVIVVGIDAFEAYIENYGEPQGNDCLTKLARAIEGALLRPGDIPGRYGPAEFGVLLPATGRPGAATIIDRITAAVAGLDIEHDASPVSHKVTVTFGIATCMPNLEAASTVLLQAAEQDLQKI
jgi:two-component system chemotaxis family response regulator WspR